MLVTERVTKKFGGLVANGDVSIRVRPGEIVGLIGPNGAGKSTLFNVVSGFYRPDSGRVLFKGKDITGMTPEAVCSLGLVRTFQIVKPFMDMSVLENTMVGAFNRTFSTRESRERALEVLDSLGLYEKRHSPARNLTVADQKRLEIARAMATGPEMIMLDEVMAGLNPKETQEAVELIREINGRGMTMLIVEHVMEVIMPISDRVVVLDGGRLIAEGPPEEVSRDEKVIKAYLGEKYHATGG